MNEYEECLYCYIMNNKWSGLEKEEDYIKNAGVQNALRAVLSMVRAFRLG